MTERVKHSGPDTKFCVLCLSGEHERVDDEPYSGTQQCGHDDYHGAHEWADRPSIWCPGHSFNEEF